MVQSKRLTIKCFDKRCLKDGAEFLYFSYVNPSNKQQYSFVTFYCKNHQHLDIDKTWWNFDMIFEMVRLMEARYNYADITAILNKKFNVNLEGHSSSKGFKGGVVKKMEKMRQNAIEWQRYTDDKLLEIATMQLFRRLCNEKDYRYGILRDRSVQQ